MAIRKFVDSRPAFQKAGSHAAGKDRLVCSFCVGVRSIEGVILSRSATPWPTCIHEKSPIEVRRVLILLISDLQPANVFLTVEGQVKLAHGRSSFDNPGHSRGKVVAQ